MLAKGRGVRKDESQAVLWYQRAADQGLGVAQNNLGVMLEEGRGVHKTWNRHCSGTARQPCRETLTRWPRCGVCSTDAEFQCRVNNDCGCGRLLSHPHGREARCGTGRHRHERRVV